MACDVSPVAMFIDGFPKDVIVSLLLMFDGKIQQLQIYIAEMLLTFSSFILKQPTAQI